MRHKRLISQIQCIKPLGIRSKQSYKTKLNFLFPCRHTYFSIIKNNFMLSIYFKTNYCKDKGERYR